MANAHDTGQQRPNHAGTDQRRTEQAGVNPSRSGSSSTEQMRGDQTRSGQSGSGQSGSGQSGSGQSGIGAPGTGRSADRTGVDPRRSSTPSADPLRAGGSGSVQASPGPMHAGQAERGTGQMRVDQVRTGQPGAAANRMQGDQARPHAMRPDQLHGAADPGGETARLIDETRHAAKEQANALWNDARHAARTKVSEQKQEAAGQIGQFAQALRAAGKQFGGESQPAAARLTEVAAGGLDRLAGTLRDKDLDEMLREAEALARRRPLALFAAAVTAGFVAVRFLKSSGTDTHADRGPGEWPGSQGDQRPASPMQPSGNSDAERPPRNASAPSGSGGSGFRSS